ncbi:hypothetical protein KIW84_020859 [Lathyrus oleraceus]|uniref:Uncharacterized protein n=1 Tax=Pisum sativum TaxID=3888 RepID=A0A9D4Y684_PEA|nr:hypothetical protein KIW84_020859 [Pisum sativum]
MTGPEKKFFFNQPSQDEEALSNKMITKEKEPELEAQPSEVTDVIKNCCEFDNQINLISEAYHLVYGGPKNLLDESCNLTEIETPMENSVLHIAAWNGNDDIVALLIERAPKLLFKSNKNNDSVLHVAARNGRTIKRDEHKRLPLHYAASIGYLEGVELLLGICKCCTIKRDEYGYFPIHLASYGGHVEVVKKLLQYCPDPTEMLDTSHKRNILHIAANHGKYEIVCYILQSDIPEHQKLINQKDNNGDTPLHLAARSCHPTTVYYLVNQNNEKVNLNLVNKYNETALDIVNSLYEVEKSSLRQASSSILLQAHKIFISMLVAS